jgi:Rrf2 family iron-sulfur cluster assembly transcriptional regulator
VRVVRELDGAAGLLERVAGAALGQRVVRPVWKELNDEVMRRLDAITIEDLCLRAHKDGVPGEYGAKIDFTI